MSWIRHRADRSGPVSRMIWRLVVPVVALGGVVWGTGVAVTGLSRESADWLAESAVEYSEERVAALMTEAVDLGLLRHDGASDALVLSRAAPPGTDPDDAAVRAALRQAGSAFGPGPVLRREIEGWNVQRSLIAVRDTTCDRVPLPCPGTPWRVEAVLEQGTQRSEMAGLGGGEPPWLHFGFIANGMQRVPVSFGDWTMIALGGMNDLDMILSATVPNRAGAWTIDVLGDVRGLTVAGASVTAEAASRTRWCLDPAQGQFSSTKAAACDAGDVPVGTRIVLRDPVPGSAVEIMLRPVDTGAVARRRITGGGQRARLTPSLSLDCPDGPLEPCVPLWREKETRVAALLPRTPETHAQADEDGIYRPTPVGTAIGAGEMAARARTVRLSIDATVQCLASNAMLRAVERRDPGLASRVPALHDARRRAGIVLIDLKDDAGAVQAAVSWPRPVMTTEGTGGTRCGRLALRDRARTRPERTATSYGVSRWDASALAYHFMADAPGTIYAWEGTGSVYAPGSVFKLLTAFALVDAVLDTDHPNRRTILRAMLGAPTAFYSDTFGIAPNAQRSAVAPGMTHRVRNFRKQSFAFNARTMAKYGGCDAARERAARAFGQVVPETRGFGLCEALARSSNMWFGALAVTNEAVVLNSLDRPGARERMRLPQSVGKLFPVGTEQRYDMFKPLRETAQARALRGTSMAVQIQMDMPSAVAGPSPSRQAMMRLAAVESFGQGGVQATPLAMATVAASLALEKRVQPSVVTGGASTRPWALPNDERTAAMVGLIRAGMGAVVRAPSGTGTTIFNGPLRGRVFAKTGTAQLDERTDGETAPVSAWLVGWVMSNGANPVPETAFACMISHVMDAPGNDSAGGASICGPLIADLLAQIEERS